MCDNVKALKELVNLRADGLPFNIWVHAGTEGRPGAFSYDRWHEFTEIIYVMDGYIDQKINGKTYKMGKGDLAFINGLDFHSLYTYPGVNAKLLIMQIPPSFVSLLYREPTSHRIISNYFKCNMDDSVNLEMQECIQNIIEEFLKKGNAYGYYLASYVYKLLGAIFRNSNTIDRNYEEFIQQKLLLEKISPALDYLYKNFKNQISIKEISAVLGMCGQHFCKCFKKATKYTFTHYLNELRILYAQDMLITTDMNITEIAYSSGFSSTSYFNRMFKRISGSTPLHFRRK
jgi:xylan 1,4-beta-xylosidase